jgi:hypothetical protein
MTPEPALYVIIEAAIGGPVTFVSTIPDHSAFAAWSARKFRSLGEAAIYAPQLCQPEALFWVVRADDPKVEIVERRFKQSNHRQPPSAP